MSEFDLNYETSGFKIPEKSKLMYENIYKRFDDWCRSQNIEYIDEEVMTEYYTVTLASHSASTIWSQFFILKAMIMQHKNVNIGNFHTLTETLRKRAKKYKKKKKSNVFTKAQVETFLQSADDDRFLATKVILIVGIFAGCQREQLALIDKSDIEDLGHCIRIAVIDRRTNIRRQSIVTEGNVYGVNMLDLIRKYISLRPSNCAHNRFFVAYKDGKCSAVPLGINSVGGVARTVAKYLKLPDVKAFTGACFKESSKTLLAEFEVNVVHLKRYGMQPTQEIVEGPSVLNYETGTLEKEVVNEGADDLLNDALTHAILGKHGNGQVGDDENEGMKEEFDSAQDEEETGSNDGHDPLSAPNGMNGPVSNGMNAEMALTLGKTPIYFNNLKNCTIVIEEQK